MLNPERVDWDKQFDIVTIGFTDSDGDEVLDVSIEKKDAERLGKMIMEAIKNG